MESVHAALQCPGGVAILIPVVFVVNKVASFPGLVAGPPFLRDVEMLV